MAGTRIADESSLMPPEDSFTPPRVRHPSTSALDVVEGTGAAHAAMRPFLQVYFVCSNSYQRVHRSADNSRYLARCPKCGKEMCFQVGSGGTDQRAFQVSCL